MKFDRLESMPSGEPEFPTEAAPALRPRPASPIVFLIIACAAFVAIVPMFWFGIPSGHDFEFHINSWMEIASQWRQGIVYPRWAALANSGYGEPRFVFYPPASWLFGAALGMVLPWALVPGVYMWAVLTAAGCSMFALARGCLPRRDALFVAVFYAVNPYHLVIVYWRSAFAELMAGAWLPLLLLWTLRLEKEGRRAALWLTLVVAAAWLTNAPAAVMVNYSLVLLAAVTAWLHRSLRPLGYGAVACALGVSLAAFYVLPAAWEEKWVNISSALTPGLRPQANFLFARIDDADHNRFNLLVSIVAVTVIAILCAALWFSRRRRGGQPDLWWSLAAWGGSAVLLMLPCTLVAWEFLPQLRFVQFPWRWLLCLNVPFVLLLAMAARRALARAVICAALLVTLLIVWNKVQPPWWDRTEDVAELKDNQEDGRGYEGVGEYVPSGGNVRALKIETPEVMLDGDIGARVDMGNWMAESKSFTVTTPRPARLALRLLSYPAWKAYVNERLIPVEARQDSGQIVIPVPAGENKVRLIFTRTPDRIIGMTASLAAALIVMAMAIREKIH